MKNILKIFLAALSIIVVFAACNKIDNLYKLDPLPLYEKGMSPVLSASVATVAPAVADSSKPVITFSWTNPKYSNDSVSTKYIVEIDTTGGNFTKAIQTITLGKLSSSPTARELNAILINLGFKVGVAQTIDVRVLSSYGNNNERYASNTVKVTVTPFADPAVFSASATSITTSLVNAANKVIDFSWTRPFPGYTGGVTYVAQYDSAGKSFATPLEIGLDPLTPNSKSYTQAEMNATALNLGVVGGTIGKIAYRIKTTTATGVVTFSNIVLVTIQTYFPVRRFYLPGGYQSITNNGDDWTPENAPEFIRDLRPGLLNDMYYMYIFIPSGNGFKITQGRSWNINFGSSVDGSMIGDLKAGGGDLSVPTSGFYRISINAATLKYEIREGRMGFVGGATGAGWNPPNVFPTYALGAAATNLFVGITKLKNDGWKLIDNNSWNNGGSNPDPNDTRSFGTPDGNGSTLDVNGRDFGGIAGAPVDGVQTRIIWDGRDVNNVKYFKSPATEMRVVGNGMAAFPEWNPGGSPQMNYQGNGVWTITLALVSGKAIKFLSGNDWGAFDYEDNGSTGVAGERKIKWENGDDFKTPATSGTYTITLNENKQTVKISL